jgi:hypothetical protein
MDKLTFFSFECLNMLLKVVVISLLVVTLTLNKSKVEKKELSCSLYGLIQSIDLAG